MNLKRKYLSQIPLVVFFTVICALVIIPFLMLVSVSVSNEADIAEFGYKLMPKRIDFSAYEYIFQNPTAIINAYKTTTLYSVLGTFMCVLVQAMCAFPISRRNLKGRRAISFYIYFTMLFSGGLVPSFILITQYLHLNDTIWVYILPMLVNPWNIFMMRTFFAGLPEEMFESMMIDGASVYNMFWKTVLPLSKPVLATVALLTFLGKWNDWNTSMLYINKEELMSLQFLLQRIMNNLKLLQDMSAQGMGVSTGGVSIPSETVRMAMAIVLAGPALIVFPFFQKYFVKGLTVGSVKG